MEKRELKREEKGAEERLPIGREEIDEAQQTMMKYRSEKQALTNRVVNAEEWWKNNH